MKNAAFIHIGTSGCHYPPCIGMVLFYPQELAQKDWFDLDKANYFEL